MANRLNHKVAKYASWKPDSESCFINAFSKNWKQFAYIYCFPLFSLIWKTLSKISKASSKIKSTTDNTNVEHTELVPNDSSKYNKNTNNIQQSTSAITRDKQQTSIVPKIKASCIPFIEQHIRTPCTAKLWNSLPIECFPLAYDPSGFKSRINRHLLTAGSFTYLLFTYITYLLMPRSGCLALHGVNSN